MGRRHLARPSLPEALSGPGALTEEPAL